MSSSSRLTAGCTHLMMRYFLGLTGFFLCYACASGHHAPYNQQELSIRRNLAAVEHRLASAVSASPAFSMQTIGHVHYDGFQAPLWLVSYRPPKADGRRILINGGIHGNEPAGVECIVQVIESLATHQSQFTEPAVDWLPIVNPWGWAHDIRYNPAGIDINRDFAGKHSTEARLVIQFLKDKEYDLMVDLHEDPSAAGFYLYQYGLPQKIISEEIVASIAAAGYPIEDNVNMLLLKTRNGIIDAPMWGLHYMQLSGQLSIANYYRLNCCRRVYTVETPTHLPFADRVKIQRSVVNQLIEKTLQ